MIKNIVFDLYGTLVDIHTDETKDSVWETMSWFYRLHQVKCTPQKLKKETFSLIRTCELEKQKALGDHHLPEIDLTHVFQMMFEKHGVDCDQRLAEETTCLFRSLTLERLRLYRGMKDLLECLKKAEKKVYLLTNAQKVFTEKEIRYLGIESCFDDIIYSSEEGIRKPDPAFFQVLINRYQLNPEETVMIGNDAECDVCGALNAGLHAIFLKSNIHGKGRCPDSILQIKVTEIETLKAEIL